ncbi:MAG: hypothetical protein RLP14_04540 [Owenweeksia sp.]
MSRQNKNYLLLVLSSLLLTLFLFFIDEGYYDFRWTKDWGNWIAFGIYVSGIYFGQWFVYYLMQRFYKGHGKIILSMVGGSVLGIALVISILVGLL